VHAARKIYGAVIDRVGLGEALVTDLYPASSLGAWCVMRKHK
jgi:hypothetical protein